jgi:hypothetical protein
MPVHVPPCGASAVAWSLCGPVTVSENDGPSTVHPGPVNAFDHVVPLHGPPAEPLVTLSVPCVQLAACVTLHVHEQAVEPTVGGPETSWGVKLGGHGLLLLFRS